MASGAGVQYVPTAGPGPVTTWQGIYYGYIAVNVDPLDQGRVKLRVPQVFGNTSSGWASPMVPLAYIPKVGTAVTVMFVGGDPARPVWGGNFAIPGGSAGFVVAAAEPASPQLGEVWVNTATGLMSEWNGASWIGYQIGGAAIQAAVSLQQPNITGGTITGSQFIATGTTGEILAYTGDPALGNLLTSVSGANGTDGKDNDYLDGVTVYSGDAHIQLHVNATVGAAALEMPTGVTSEEGAGSFYTWSPNKGATAEYIESYWQGPASTSDSKSAAIVLQSTNKDGTGGAGGSLLADGAVVATWNGTGLTVNGTLTASNVVLPGTWTAMTLQNGWTVGSGGIARYKLMSDNTVTVHCSNLTPGILTNATAFWFIPTGYIPASSATQNFPVAWGVGTSAAPSFQANPVVYTRSNGLYISNFPTTTVGISFVIRYALD